METLEVLSHHESILGKIRRVACLSFENATRLHEDAVLLFKDGRIASAQLLSVLSIEEIGKYLMHEDVWWHNSVDAKWSIQDIQLFLRDSVYSHTRKHHWFARHTNHGLVAKPLLRCLETGALEAIKQRATYVGFPRAGKNIDFGKRVSTPARLSKQVTHKWITMVNDYFVEAAVGVRKGWMLFDIPEIDQWLAEQQFEKHFVGLWPHMRPAVRRHVDLMRRDADEQR